ncbi:hypothetical protein E1B28_004868 [Marasmius oreades]|uniref:Uncharacterized protein n=1 Tax=Marasmius oreades TaxID=181124 RepID=A0A9P7UZF8_9AGAR|nr:uncharacterized protein E1B28_004868 [Marasmius oreades]KAG7097525.1 hypothetical protein E1B28_004868 [Marasmius oreades]
MVPPKAFVFILTALITAVAVRADATPIEPGPGSVFKQGGECHTAWTGDKDGKWANMAIQLMTGADLKMVHLTTVATGLDGNQDGSFQFICPEVDPYSAIYFLQFSSPQSSGFQWATRFTIADKDGKSVPPPEATQPDGRSVPWGTGRLVNPSDARPPPDFQNASSSSNSSSSSSASQSSSSAGADPSSIMSSASIPVQTPTRMTTASNTQGGRTTGSPSAGNANTNGTAGNNNDNGALSMEYGGAWMVVFMFASTFALYL